MSGIVAVTIVPPATYATLRGVSRQYVHKLIRDGKLTPPAVTADRKIDIAEADRQLAAQRDPGKGRRGRPALDETDMLRLVPEPVPPVPLGQGPAQGTLAHAKLLAAQSQAVIAQEQARKARGESVDIKAARRVTDLFAEAVVQALEKLGEDAVTALRSAATTDEARRAWKKLQAQVQLEVPAIAGRLGRELGADA